MPEPILDLLCVTAPGLEAITLGEIASLGVTGASVIKGGGGIAWRGSMRDMQLVNLHCRTASRVVIRIARFHASTFHELERRARQVPWGRYVRRADRVSFRVTCHKSALYHSDGVAQRLAEAVTAVTGAAALVADGEAVGTDPVQSGSAGHDQLFIGRLDHDELTISVDSSGALLHRRGYRQETAKAPLRETLAAAMLLDCGWTADQALMDPMCGAGTIPIEAAMIARRIAPGINRSFSFEKWPGFNPGRWNSLKDEAIGVELKSSAALIVGGDRDAGAIIAAGNNATRAGVAADIAFSERSISESLSQPPASNGWIVTNPPYGIRLGEDVRDLYATLGKSLDASMAGWRLAMLAPMELEGHVGVRLERMFDTSNGGIPVSMLRDRE